MKTTECPQCKKNISNNNIKKHINSKSCVLQVIKSEDFIKISDEVCKCNICGKEYNKYGIKNHIWRNHTEEGSKFDPNIGYTDGSRVAWNKGTNYVDVYGFEKSQELKYNLSENAKKLVITADFIEKCRQNALARGFGGITRGGGRGKKGWYKGFWCDSSWELAFVIYNIDNSIEFIRNQEKFKYTYNGVQKSFYPDFIVGNIYVEIKGYNSDEWKQKLKEFPHEIVVLYQEEMKLYLDYVKNKYGDDFIKLYDS